MPNARAYYETPLTLSSADVAISIDPDPDADPIPVRTLRGQYPCRRCRKMLREPRYSPGLSICLACKGRDTESGRAVLCSMRFLRKES